MNLRDLNPRLKGSVEEGVLVFDCPSGKPHSIRVYIHSKPYGEKIAPMATCGCGKSHRYWQAQGEFPDSLTLTPSINEQHTNPKTGKVEFQCWHGTIIGGEVK